jgi:hypothetical protein
MGGLALSWWLHPLSISGQGEEGCHSGTRRRGKKNVCMLLQLAANRAACAKRGVKTTGNKIKRVPEGGQSQG